MTEDLDTRDCSVLGCTYTERRGSREGHFINGAFVCPYHALGHNPGAHFQPDFERIGRLAGAMQLAEWDVLDWMHKQGEVGNLVSAGQSPHWSKYTAAKKDFERELTTAYARDYVVITAG